MMRDFILSMFVKKINIQLQQKKDRDIYKITSVDNTALNYNKEVIDHETEDT